MIPKIVHYCWLSGDKLPEAFQEYLDGWKKMLPDYEFIKWDFKRLDQEDYSFEKWSKEAYSVKRYAWASDPIRLYALHKYGGIYMDLDVELLKSFDAYLNRRYLFGQEFEGNIEAGIMGAEPGIPMFKLVIDNYYSDSHYINDDGSHNSLPLPSVINKVVSDEGQSFLMTDSLDVDTSNENVYYLLAPDFLSAKKGNTIMKSDRTITIHHFAASSAKRSYTIKKWIYNNLGKSFYNILIKLKAVFIRKK